MSMRARYPRDVAHVSASCCRYVAPINSTGKMQLLFRARAWDVAHPEYNGTSPGYINLMEGAASQELAAVSCIVARGSSFVHTQHYWARCAAGGCQQPQEELPGPTVRQCNTDCDFSWVYVLAHSVSDGELAASCGPPVLPTQQPQRRELDDALSSGASEPPAAAVCCVNHRVRI